MVSRNLRNSKVRCRHESGKRRGGAVPLIVARASIGLAWAASAAGVEYDRVPESGFSRRAAQSLARSIVDAEHQSAVRRIEVKPHNVTDFLDKQRIGGKLEGLRTMRLHRLSRRGLHHYTLDFGVANGARSP